MIPLELSETADADLAEILSYGTDAFGEEAGEAYVAGFARIFALICEHPFAGAVHKEVRPPIRSISHGSHRVFCDVLTDRRVVQRILHKAMDVERHF